jgi:MFS family permease
MRTGPTLYLASYALSVLGNSIAAVALPLLVLQTTGSLLSTGTLAAATAIPAFLAGLLAGVVIDRVNRRSSSIVTDLVSAASIAALPLVDLATGLNLGWFILFGIVGAVGDVPGLTAREAMLPAIVRHGSLTAERLIGLREGIGALVMLVGPASAGTLMTIFGGSTVLWITAGTSLAAALLTMLIPRRVGVIPGVGGSASALGVSAGLAPGRLSPARGLSGRGRTGRGRSRRGWSGRGRTGRPAAALRELAEGWRVLFRTNRFLRAVTLLNLMMIVALSSLQGLVLPAHFALIEEPGMLGFVLTALAGGSLLGGVLYAWLARAGARRRWFVVGVVGTVIGIGVIGVLPPLAVLFAGAFVLGISAGMFGSLIGVLMIEAIPEQMRGRIMGTQNSLMMLAAPVGMVLVSLVGAHVDLRTAGIVVAVLWAVTGICALAAPALRQLEPAEGSPDDEKQ